MKKILVFAVMIIMVAALGLAACNNATPEATPAPAPAPESNDQEETPAPADVISKTVGLYADAADSYYQLLNDALVGVNAMYDDVDIKVDFKVGQSTADEQLRAVEDFITAGYDALCVIQNNPNTTSECIEKAVAANIPYFGMTHDFASAPNARDAAGAICYDFFEGGYLAGEDAAARGIAKVIMIEGVLGQGSAGVFSWGFLQAYEDAGKSLGGYSAEDIAKLKSEAKLDGTQDVEIVFWASGNWFAEAAQKAMQDAITSLGKDGFDGAYVQNNPMMEGVLVALEDAGLNPSDYWLGSCNGREISWDWVQQGKVTMDVNQPSALEGAMLSQQLRAYFKGESYRQYIHPYFTPYNIDNIQELLPSLVPATDIDAFLLGYANQSFTTDINDPKFKDNVGFK